MRTDADAQLSASGRLELRLGLRGLAVKPNPAPFTPKHQATPEETDDPRVTIPAGRTTGPLSGEGLWGVRKVEVYGPVFTHTQVRLADQLTLLLS